MVRVVVVLLFKSLFFSALSKQSLGQSGGECTLHMHMGQLISVIARRTVLVEQIAAVIRVDESFILESNIFVIFDFSNVICLGGKQMCIVRGNKMIPPLYSFV